MVVLLSFAMSEQEKFTWPELPYHRFVLQSNNADAEDRILAAQQIHAGVMHGVGGSSLNAMAPIDLALELIHELCVILGRNTPDLLAREIVWKIAHIFHKGTDTRYMKPDTRWGLLRTTVERALQEETIRSCVRHWVQLTLQEGTKKEFASSLSHARTISGIAGDELSPKRREEIKAAEIRYWEHGRMRHVEKEEQSLFDEQLREHGKVPVSYLADCIGENDFVCIDNSGKGTVLEGLNFLANVAGPLAATGLKRVAVPIPFTMQDRLADAIKRNDASALKTLLIEGGYALHMLHEQQDTAALNAYSEKHLEALQAVHEHLQIVCTGCDLRLAQDGGNALDQQITRLVPLLQRGEPILYFSCVPFVSTSFTKSRSHLTSIHASWPCSTELSLPFMVARACGEQRKLKTFCIQLAEAWHFDESFDVAKALALAFEEFGEKNDAESKLRDFTPRIHTPPYRIRRSVGIDVEKTLLKNKRLNNYQETFGDAYNGLIILAHNNGNDDRDPGHIHQILPNDAEEMNDDALRTGVLIEM